MGFAHEPASSRLNLSAAEDQHWPALVRCGKAYGTRAGSRQYTLGEVVKAAVQLDETETSRFDQELEKREEVKKMLLTWDEALAESKAQGMALGKTEGMALGKTEGEAMGRAEGEIKQAREAVLLVVRHRWGSVPNDFAAKLESIIELARLHEIMEQVLDVQSLDEIDLNP